MQQAADAVGDLFAAIEIVENRYGDLAELGTPTLIADQMFHAAAVVGDPGTTNWRVLDVASLPGRITVDGDVRGEGVGADLLGHPLNSLAWLAGSSVAAAFDGLQPGQVILLGGTEQQQQELLPKLASGVPTISTPRISSSGRPSG